MRKRCCAVVLLVLLTAAVSAAQEPLDAAKELYASAEYERALAVLDKLKNGADTYPVAVDEYRAYCLLALGRAREAEAAIGSLVTADPMHKPDEGDISPRTRSLFDQVRLRVLPSVVQQQYADAKGAFDRKAYSDATHMFERLLQVTSDPQLAKDPMVGDIVTLASGFLELSQNFVRPALPPPVSQKTEKQPASKPAVALAYGITQRFPPWPAWLPRVRTELRGEVQIEIDVDGRVSSARMIKSIHPVYDGILLVQAKEWRFSPATRDGRPIQSTQTVVVVVQP